MPNYRIVEFRGKWYVAWQAPGGIQRRSLRTADRRLAEQRFLDFKRALASRDNTVGSIVEKYLDEKGYGEKHPRWYAWQAAKQKFARLRPDQITRDVCKEYIAHRQRDNRSSGTIIVELGVVRAALRWADRNTPAVFQFPPSDAPSRHEFFLSREQYDALFAAAAPYPHLQLFIRLGISTGARPEAILDLTWNRVDFLQNNLRFAGMTTHRNKRRPTVRMTPKLIEALQEARKIRQTDYVIEWRGKRVRSIRKAFSRAVEDAGLPATVTPYILRHSAASWLAMEGADIKVIADFLGHTDIKITFKHYAHLSPHYMSVQTATLNV